MKNNLDFIFSRRSVRQFIDKKIEHETLVDIISAAMSAPSAMKKDPWRFILIENKETLAELAKFLPNGSFVEHAAAAVIALGDIDIAHSNSVSYMLQDVACAIENLLLAANAYGIGSCYLGVHPREERIELISELFDLPSNIIPIAAVALGYSDTKIEARNRFNEEYLHLEKW